MLTKQRLILRRTKKSWQETDKNCWQTNSRCQDIVPRFNGVLNVDARKARVDVLWIHAELLVRIHCIHTRREATQTLDLIHGPAKFYTVFGLDLFAFIAPRDRAWQFTHATRKIILLSRDPPDNENKHPCQWILNAKVCGMKYSMSMFVETVDGCACTVGFKWCHKQATQPRYAQTHLDKWCKTHCQCRWCKSRPGICNRRVICVMSFAWRDIFLLILLVQYSFQHFLLHGVRHSSDHIVWIRSHWNHHNEKKCCHEKRTLLERPYPIYR